MDWSKGFSASYYGTFVDPVTWYDIGTFNIKSGSVSDSDSYLIQSADIECVDFDQSREHWVRIWLDARQGGDSYHGALFTGLTSTPNKKISGLSVSVPVQCYSVLKPAEDVPLDRGWYISAGTNGAMAIKELLSVGPAPVVIDEYDSPSLTETIIAEDNESYLSMALKILDAIGWRIKIDGDGTIHICEMASDISVTFDSIDNDCFETEIDISNDWYSCPNVFRAIQGDLIGTAYDDSEDSELSTVNRGREVWYTETNCNLGSYESIDDYAARRLEEEQNASFQISYNRRFFPNVRTTDLIRVNYPAQDISGVFLITSQNISLSHGATVSEVSIRING